MFVAILEVIGPSQNSGSIIFITLTTPIKIIKQMTNPKPI